MFLSELHIVKFLFLH